MATILSGCITSYTPEDTTVVVVPGETRSFQIEIFPPRATVTWLLDDAVVQEGADTL